MRPAILGRGTRDHCSPRGAVSSEPRPVFRIRGFLRNRAPFFVFAVSSEPRLQGIGSVESIDEGTAVRRDQGRHFGAILVRMIYKVGVALCIIFTVYGQIAAKIATRQIGPLPADWGGRLAYLGQVLLNPYFISCFVAAVLAALSWITALTGLELSRAYP